MSSSISLEHQLWRWKRQFTGEVNYKADLQRFFLTDTSAVMNTLCKHEEVATQLFKFKETLPGLLGAWEEPSPEEVRARGWREAAGESTRRE